MAWYTAPNSGASVPIGPSDPWHTATSSTLGNYVNETATIITDTGLVAGSATRYAPGTTTTDGSDAWVYNTISGELDILDPDPDSTNNFTSSITYLSPNGVAVGEYAVGHRDIWGRQAFVWSAVLGFEGSDIDDIHDRPEHHATNGCLLVQPGDRPIFTSGQYVSPGPWKPPVAACRSEWPDRPRPRTGLACPGRGAGGDGIAPASAKCRQWSIVNCPLSVVNPKCDSTDDGPVRASAVNLQLSLESEDREALSREEAGGSSSLQLVIPIALCGANGIRPSCGVGRVCGAD